MPTKFLHSLKTFFIFEGQIEKYRQKNLREIAVSTLALRDILKTSPSHEQNIVAQRNMAM